MLRVLFLATAFISLPAVGNLRIYHVDVEQADATLIVAPTGEALLVDGGKNSHGDRLKAAVARMGVAQIDHLVVTHYHEDHYGGVDDLVSGSDAVTVVNVYDRGDKAFLPASKTSQKTFIDYQDKLGHRATHLMRGESIALGPEVTALCISSGGAVLGEPNPATHGNDENDMSVSLLISYRNFRFFVGGDIEAHTEGKIADLDLVTDVDLYQANHHGSHTSSSPEFIADLSPTVTVISNGSTRAYRHPRQVTLDTLSGLATPVAVFQTNKYLAGGLDFGNVADGFIADLETSDKDGNILVTVEDSNFIVSYGTHSHTFPIRIRGTGSLRIASILPNPVGSDFLNEEATLVNQGMDGVDLTGWLLRDQNGRVWPLGTAGSVAVGQQVTVVRNGMPMSLNNDGDVIELVDPSNSVVDTLTYPSSTEGVAIPHP